ncbi:MAG: O-antigen ligase family protein [Patescibacteria group bacterium]
MFFLFVLAILWGFTAWRLPRMAVLWLPALTPLYLLRTHLGPFPTTLLELLVAMTVMGVTVKQGWKPWKTGIETLRSWWIPTGLWILASLIAVFVAPNHVAALGLWRAYILEPILFFILLAGTLHDTKDRKAVVHALLASLGVVTLWAIVQYATGHFIPHPWNTDFLTRRATGPFPYPNALSLFAAPLAALFFGLAVFKQKDWITPKLAWIGFTIGLLDIVSAKSVGGFIGLMSGVFITLIILKKTRWWAVGVAAIIALAVFAVPTTRTKIISTLSFHEWSGHVRTIIWSETWNMLKDTSTKFGIGRPIFGAGFGAYPDVIKAYHKATYIEIFQYPHDILLNLWSETGLLGIVAFAWLCVVWWKESKGRRWLFLPLLAILVHGLVDVPYFKNDLALLFWVLAAFTIVPSIRLTEKK